jgi:hypothetical protein
MGGNRQFQLIQEFVGIIENDPQNLLLEEGTENFLRKNNIADGMDFMNALLKHYRDLSPKKNTLLTIEFLQGEYKLILENNKDFLIDWYLYYLSKNNRPLVDAIFSRKLLRDKTRMRDMFRNYQVIKEMLELPGCPDDLKNIYELKNIGFGRMADKETGEIVYKMKEGSLIDKNYPEDSPPELPSPYTDDNGDVWEWFGDICDECKKTGENPQHIHEWHVMAK